MLIGVLKVSWVRALAQTSGGRWVVAKATRRSPVASIITTCFVLLRAARYSVWPVKFGSAPSQITDLANGAVTMALKVPSRQPSMARLSMVRVPAALAGLGSPTLIGAPAGQCHTGTP